MHALGPLLLDDVTAADANATTPCPAAVTVPCHASDGSPTRTPEPTAEPATTPSTPTAAESATTTTSISHSNNKHARKRSAAAATPESQKRVSFSPRARQISIESKNDMNSEDKQQIWWQPPDYEIFGKTAKILSQRTLTCPNEKHWLCMDGGNNNNSYQHAATADFDVDDGVEVEVDIEAESKWWCRFGHSRRGLEHVVFEEEGRHRHLAVRWSRRSVLLEQNRLGKNNLSNYSTNSELIRDVSLRCTQWAADLAVASAFSDAHAVAAAEEEQQQQQRTADGAVSSAPRVEPKTRESYLLDMVLGQQQQQQQQQETTKKSSSEFPSSAAMSIRGLFQKKGRAGAHHYIPEFIKLSLRQHEVLQQVAAAAVVRNWTRCSPAHVPPSNSSSNNAEIAPREDDCCNIIRSTVVVEELDAATAAQVVGGEQLQQQHSHKRQRISDDDDGYNNKQQQQQDSLLLPEMPVSSC